jgi:SNF2 family DNA or RNA helicase
MLQVGSRDQRFRSMVRSFKTVSESDYQVPEGLRSVLRPYQKTGFRWLKTLESSGFGGILADEMGLVKTIQVIAFLSTVRRETCKKPSLIVCPASLILNWGDEFARFAPEVAVTLVMGTVRERKALLEEGLERSDVLVTSYDLLKRDISRFREQEFYCVVLDEGQFVKNQSTLASKAVKSIPCAQRFVLTGTSKEQRARLVRDFNAGKAQVFLISLKAGGTGLNLTAADVVIHYDPWWNLAAQNQATDRAHRIGQRESVQVYKLIVKDSIEEKILDLQAKKAELMDAVSDGSDESILTMSKEDLMALLE